MAVVASELAVGALRLLLNDLPQNLVQAFFVSEAVGVFDIVENLLDESACVEIVRCDAEQITFGRVVETEYVWIRFVARQSAVAVIAYFIKEACDFVVDANPAVAIGGNVLYKLL